MIRVDKCPHCGATISVGNGDKQGSIGDPFCMCYHCRHPYLEKNCYEYAVAYFYQKLIALNVLGNNLVISVLISIFVAMAISKKWPYTNYLLLILVITIILDALFTFFNYFLKSEEIEESYKRCSNPLYVLELGMVGLANINSAIYQDSLKQLRNISDFNVDDYYKIAVEKHNEKRITLFLITGLVIFLIFLILLCILVQ